MKQKLASAANYTVAAALFILAHIYLIKPSFMGYHSQALSLEWNEVDGATQTLVLALMRVCGGGWLAVSLTTVFLQWRFTRGREPWVPVVILVVGLISTLSTLYATLLVYLNTPGTPPIPGLFILILLLFAGYRLNEAGIRKPETA
ncbi:hypothetical protein [Cesiribacter sp. SM1]|uniref:hypothetical protein n=1 Tax=Cesiribacter sp. SM1 TaxID=2861196 RepID=UPI001CD6A705|nr:hypothetical protein [Cesiribacter sp. SM1]